jgi:hypothetical protein
MAAVNYYLGLKRGDSFDVGKVVAGTSTVGASADVELRIQINNGSADTGITKLDVLKALELLEAYIAQGGVPGDGGANLPAQ